MRISDWSSDVCSSDLQLVRPVAFLEADAVQRVARELRELQAKEHAEAVRLDGGAPRPVVDLARCLVEDAGVPVAAESQVLERRVLEYGCRCGCGDNADARRVKRGGMAVAQFEIPEHDAVGVRDGHIVPRSVESSVGKEGVGTSR